MERALRRAAFLAFAPESCLPGLLVHGQVVGLGLRTEGDAAARVLGRPGAALTGLAGTLLLERLLAGAGDRGAVLHGDGALPAVSELDLYGLVDQVLAHVAVEHGVVELDLTDLCFLDVKYV
jgi:hypothetical protein